jgi:cytochrome o ubiquinol oxidase subunit 1
MFGKLTLDALPHDPIIIAASLLIVGVASLVIGLLFYFKKWKWLWNEWITTVDHKKIGIMYILLSTLMFLRGFSDAMLMRTQQAVAVGESYGFLPPDHYDQIFTAHGVIMIFFVAMPLMFGLINYILPLQIGARDVAFPFLNSLSFWLTFFAAMLVNASLAIGDFAATGWLAYPPLSGIEFSPGVGVDYYIWALQIGSVGTLLSAINFFVTVLMMRAPGMTLMRMPVFTWTSFCSMILVIVSFPILTATLFMLSLDRYFGMHFFTMDGGGNPMMYVNLIWAWGHPEVYILMLPAFGIFSEIVSTFAKKRLFGYTTMIYATISITVLSFVVWVHHFFTMGSGASVNAFFGIMTMIIAIPTGVKIFNWLFTMFRGRITYASPMLWMMGFIATFTFGGMTGVLLSLPAVDFQLHNSLFLVAHFHNTIIGGVLFGYFAGIAYWFPKIFGFTLNEKLGKLAFWHWIVGFFVAFTPLYILGLLGMTRRLQHIEGGNGWQELLIISLCGAIIIGIGIFIQLLQVGVSVVQRKRHLDTTGDIWDARNLEWSTASPPPVYNFAHIPTVYGRQAFWDMKYGNQIQNLKPHFEDIHMPKNTGVGFLIAGASFVLGFALVWHIWWLAIVSFLAILFFVIMRAFDDDTEYVISKESVALIEGGRLHLKTA